MREKGKILIIESLLGFRFRSGVSRTTAETSKVPALKSLLAGIDTLKKAYVAYSPKQLRGLPSFNEEVNELFLRLGPALWPPRTADTSQWLVDDQRNLVYENLEDRQLLQEHFDSLIYEKAVQYHKNQKQASRKQEKLVALQQTSVLDPELYDNDAQVDEYLSMDAHLGQAPYYMDHEGPQDRQGSAATPGPSSASIARTGQMIEHHTRPDIPRLHSATWNASVHHDSASPTTSPSIATSVWQGTPMFDDRTQVDHAASGPYLLKGKHRRVGSNDESTLQQKRRRVAEMEDDQRESSANPSDHMMHSQRESLSAAPRTKYPTTNDPVFQSLGPVHQELDGQEDQFHRPPSDFEGSSRDTHEQSFYLLRATQRASQPISISSASSPDRTSATSTPQKSDRRFAETDVRVSSTSPSDVSNVYSEGAVSKSMVNNDNLRAGLEDIGDEYGCYHRQSPRIEEQSNRQSSSIDVEEAQSEALEEQRTAAGDLFVPYPATLPRSPNAAASTKLPIAGKQRADASDNGTHSAHAPASIQPPQAGDHVSNNDYARTAGGAPSLTRTPNGTPQAVAQASTLLTSARAVSTTTTAHPISSADRDAIAALPASRTALDTTEVFVEWGDEDDTTDIIGLTECRTQVEFFSHLRAHIPERLEDKDVKLVDVKLTNTATRNPVKRSTFRIPQSRGATAFQHLVKVLQSYPPNGAPEVECLVQFWK